MNQIAQVLLTLALAWMSGAVAQTNAEDEKAIREAAAKYVEAFNKGDIDALAAAYAKEATYDEGEGAIVSGRDEIRKVLAANMSTSPGTKMSIDIKSIRFTKSRAIEIGTATLTPAKGEPFTISYRAIHAKGPDGKWLMTSVGPDLSAEGSTASGPLEELEWLIGKWEDTESDLNLSSTCRWDRNRRFLFRTFVMKEDSQPELQVNEVIAWDPADHVVRSWVFDSDGGFGQNTWSKRGDEWIISAKGTLPDGGRASAVNIIHRIDDNTYTWSSTNRDVDGQMLPDVDDVKMVRVPDAQAASGGNK